MHACKLAQYALIKNIVNCCIIVFLLKVNLHYGQ